MNRIAKMTLTTALAVALATVAHAGTTWRMATKMPVDSPEGKVFDKFAELTEQYTNGELKIDVYPNEQLGKEDAVLEQMQSNIVQIYAESSAYMKKWEPALGWVSAAFAFDDFDHWQRFMNSDLVNSWFDNAEEKSGIRPLGDPTMILRGPYRVMVSNVPVNSYEDMAGVKLRLPESKVAIETWDHLGADVITLPWTEVYQGISKGIVQAVNSPIALVESMRFNEVAPYIARHDEYWQSVAFMVNSKALADLDDKTRDALMKAYADTGAYSKELMFGVADESVQRMKDAGATFVTIDTGPMVKNMQTFYAEMAAKGDLPEGFMEAVEATRVSAQ